MMNSGKCQVFWVENPRNDQLSIDLNTGEIFLAEEVNMLVYT